MKSKEHVFPSLRSTSIENFRRYQLEQRMAKKENIPIEIQRNDITWKDIFWGFLGSFALIAIIITAILALAMFGPTY